MVADPPKALFRRHRPDTISSRRTVCLFKKIPADARNIHRTAYAGVRVEEMKPQFAHNTQYRNNPEAPPSSLKPQSKSFAWIVVASSAPLPRPGESRLQRCRSLDCSRGCSPFPRCHRYAWPPLPPLPRASPEFLCGSDAGASSPRRFPSRPAAAACLSRCFLPQQSLRAHSFPPGSMSFRSRESGGCGQGQWFALIHFLSSR